jgi:hypothetical protein
MRSIVEQSDTGAAAPAFPEPPATDALSRREEQERPVPRPVENEPFGTERAGPFRREPEPGFDSSGNGGLLGDQPGHEPALVMAGQGCGEASLGGRLEQDELGAVGQANATATGSEELARGRLHGRTDRGASGRERALGSLQLDRRPARHDAIGIDRRLQAGQEARCVEGTVRAVAAGLDDVGPPAVSESRR